jgi:inner membrane protein YidH
VSSARGNPGPPAERDPDPRFTLANERTFLAWTRTSLSFIAAGLAVVQLLPDFATETERRLLGLPLIFLGAIIAVTSYRRWRASERAMRVGRPLPPSRLPHVITVVIGVVGVYAGVLALLDSSGR